MNSFSGPPGIGLTTPFSATCQDLLWEWSYGLPTWPMAASIPPLGITTFLPKLRLGFGAPHLSASQALA